MKVYAAEYCDCIYESGFFVLSLHTTKAGAYRTMRKSKMNAWDSDLSPEYWHHKAWRVAEYEVVEDKLTPTGATINKEGKDGDK